MIGMMASAPPISRSAVSQHLDCLGIDAHVMAHPKVSRVLNLLILVFFGLWACIFVTNRNIIRSPADKSSPLSG